MRNKVIEIIKGWAGNGESIEVTADKILELFNTPICCGFEGKCSAKGKNNECNNKLYICTYLKKTVC